MSNDMNNTASDPQPADLAEQQGPYIGMPVGDQTVARAVASLDQSLTFAQDFRAEDVRVVLAALAATGKQQVGESCTHAWRTAGGGSQTRRPLVCSKCNQHRDHMPQQVGEVQGDGRITMSEDDFTRMVEGEAGEHGEMLEDGGPFSGWCFSCEGLIEFSRGIINAWGMERRAQAAALAARQPGAQEPVDVEAALAAGDPNWQAQCRPNLRGNERLFFAVRDIAEMRAMLAGEKKPLPGSGLAVVRVNPNAPSVVPYQCAHRLLGDAYQAGEKGGGFCDQAEELFVAMTAHAKRNRMAVVYAAPPAQGIDLVPGPMDTAPRDGTMVRLLVQFTEHATEDTDGPSWTIGANNGEHDGGDLWCFAGWCWTHDHFTEGKGTPVGWLPLIDGQLDAPPGAGS